MTWNKGPDKISTSERIEELNRISRSYVRVIHKPKGRERNAYKAMRNMLARRESRRISHE